jgi:hypothetical protein
MWVTWLFRDGIMRSQALGGATLWIGLLVA